MSEAESHISMSCPNYLAVTALGQHGHSRKHSHPVPACLRAVVSPPSNQGREYRVVKTLGTVRTISARASIRIISCVFG